MGTSYAEGIFNWPEFMPLFRILASVFNRLASTSHFNSVKWFFSWGLSPLLFQPTPDSGSPLLADPCFVVNAVLCGVWLYSTGCQTWCVKTRQHVYAYVYYAYRRRFLKNSQLTEDEENIYCYLEIFTCRWRSMEVQHHARTTARDDDVGSTTDSCRSYVMTRERRKVAGQNV